MDGAAKICQFGSFLVSHWTHEDPWVVRLRSRVAANTGGGDPQATFKRVSFSDLTAESSISRHPFAEKLQVSTRPPESWWRLLGERRMKKSGLKCSVQKIKIMASDPVTSWQIDGETMQAVTDFIFLGLKITADSDCSHEMNRHLLLGRKAMTNLDSVLKSRDITLPTKVHLVKDMVFPVVMYGCENWTIKKTEHQRIDAFELWWWRRLLRVPWIARRSNQSILKETTQVFIGRTNVEAEAPILWPLDIESQLIGKDPGAGKDWGQKEKGVTEDEMVG